MPHGRGLSAAALAPLLAPLLLASAGGTRDAELPSSSAGDGSGGSSVKGGSDHGQAQAARALLQRRLPAHIAEQFALEVEPIAGWHDFPLGSRRAVASFELAPGLGAACSAAANGSSSNRSSCVLVRGSDGVALSSGVYYYLRNYANASFSWWGDNLGSLPPPGQPLTPPPTLTRTSVLKWRFYLNYCVFCYSTPWWSWERWERELDYAALLGVNVVNVGLQLQTAPIERAVFVEDFGLARADLPPEGLPCAGDYGGAAPAALETRNVELAQRILRRLRSLGKSHNIAAVWFAFFSS